MNKKYLSVLIIIATIILSGFMIFRNKTNTEDGLIQVKNKDLSNTKEILSEKDKITDVDLEELLNIIEMSKEKLEKSKAQSNEDELKTQVETTNTDEVTDEEKVKNPTISEEQMIEYEKTTENTINETVQVFKVDKTTIVEKLSFDEKLLLLNLTKELSMNDYATIIKSIKNKGELECVREVNRILESRLNDKSYESVKKVVEPYINMEVLE
ncbi:MAG: hypothetical protein ACRC41_17870 [Sarcina sp.]